MRLRSCRLRAHDSFMKGPPGFRLPLGFTKAQKRKALCSSSWKWRIFNSEGGAYGLEQPLLAFLLAGGLAEVPAYLYGAGEHHQRANRVFSCTVMIETSLGM
ncbi:OLC1v1021808C1 [Oldenlandia corymbosa var. corymbosa]|uniref:OLC1v1021808C1 n=1 Tax=Oldenlandia corymbosa var. corymbosa TaxID=529605 RepID=A0AAV1BZ18_OLDCO|nr:OLC1v1021808C1 [Oldenlandia corymbosa var. corymbosa]